mmetsp:Transcript_64884/g.135972  ORF Transcript_64884/g.135972 Transcript_64884/m.135972 type:complete len:121 (+) Transcript_64884:110-472(+)
MQPTPSADKQEEVREEQPESDDASPIGFGRWRNALPNQVDMEDSGSRVSSKREIEPSIVGPGSEIEVDAQLRARHDEDDEDEEEDGEESEEEKEEDEEKTKQDDVDDAHVGADASAAAAA